MFRPPPRSTLFPYTTLFRSTIGGLTTFMAFITFLTMPLQQIPAMGSVLVEAIAGLERTQDLLGQATEDENPDRKSTRLNSSHTVISYAVFCLKKKKNNKKIR